MGGLAQSSCTDHAPTSGSFVASLNFLPHDGHEKCFMCSAGPRPFFGCISHSFAGPTTSPPHFRHFTKRFSPLFGRSRMADMKVHVDLSRLLLGPLVGCNMNGGALPHVQPVELPWASHTPWLVYECFNYGTLIYSVGLLIYRNSAEPVKSKFRLCEAHINRRSRRNEWRFQKGVCSSTCLIRSRGSNRDRRGEHEGSREASRSEQEASSKPSIRKNG